MTERIYKRGLVKTAGEIDMAPSNLSVALAGAGRNLDVDKLELYLEKTKDFEPLYYLVEKFLKDEAKVTNNHLADRIDGLLSEVRDLAVEVHNGASK